MGVIGGDGVAHSVGDLGVSEYLAISRSSCKIGSYSAIFMKKVVNFGKNQYATVQLRKGKWLYTATERVKGQVINWDRLTKRAASAHIEAQ